MLLDDPLRPTATKAIVLSCARSFCPTDSLFDTQPGELQVIRIVGNSCKKNDGVVGSCEFALAQSEAKGMMPHVMIVLGNARNDVVEQAVRKLMVEHGRGDDCPPPHVCKGEQGLQLGIVDSVMVSARDAYLQEPAASYEKMCELTTKLNAFNTIETLMRSSRAIYDLVATERIKLVAAYFDVDSGKVAFMGTHPSLVELVHPSNAPPKEAVRTASDPPVPAEEALATMYAGNKRYAVGKGGQTKVEDKRLLVELSEGGQNPASVVLGCADSRAPIEILFDVRPGDLFVLRNAGNTCASAKGSVIGSAEYAVSHLHTKLLVVTGHTKCGAVTAAIQTVQNYCEKNQIAAGSMSETQIDEMMGSLSSVAGSIGNVLANIVRVAAEAIRQNPQGSLADLVTLGIRLNVFSTIEKLIRYSDIVRTPVIKGEVQVHGSVYDIFSGQVIWLGEHPGLPKIVEQPMGLHVWKVSPYVRTPTPVGAISADTKKALDRLKEGNRRFLKGEYHPGAPREVPDPFAIVVGGAEVRVPIEKIFDTGPGDLIVQRCMGSIAGRLGATLFDSIEYAVVRFAPKCLVVMGESDSEVISSALAQIAGSEVPTSSMRAILDRVMVSALRAVRQVEKDPACTLAGKEMKIRHLTVELNTFYTIEQLMCSKIIRNAVRTHGLEIHSAVLNERTGQVEFVGRHPQEKELLDETRYS